MTGLALNFVPDAARTVAELARVTRPDGTVAADGSISRIARAGAVRGTR